MPMMGCETGLGWKGATVAVAGDVIAWDSKSKLPPTDAGTATGAATGATTGAGVATGATGNAVGPDEALQSEDFE